jgi:hypothetical protein
MEEYKPANGATLRVVNGQYRLGFVQDGEWIDAGPAVLRMTSHREETGAYTMEWVLAHKDDRPME